MEQVTRKTANYLSEVLEDQREKLLENLTANGMDLATFLTRFQWDMAKYPIKQSLRNLTDIISEYMLRYIGYGPFREFNWEALHFSIKFSFHCRQTAWPNRERP